MKACGLGTYCCYDLGGCECSSSSLYDLGPATSQSTIPLSPSTPAPTSASTTTAAVTTPTQAASQTVTSPSSLTASPTSAPPEPNASAKTTAIAAGVGAGVGVPLVLAIAAVAFFLRRRKKKASQSSPYVGIDGKAELHVPESRHEAAAGYYDPVEASSTPIGVKRNAHEHAEPQELATSPN